MGEFPSHIVSETETKSKKKKKRTDEQSMYESIVQRLDALFVDEMGGLIEKYELIGSSLHKFSHINQTCHVFRVYLDKQVKADEDSLIYDGDFEWIAVKT